MSTNKILIVDDEPDMAEFISDVVEGEDLESIISNSAKEALKHLDEKEISGIFMDVVMPDMDGIELIQAIAKTGKVIPTVIMSGYNAMYLDTAKSIGEVVGLPILGVLIKPFNADQVIEFTSQISNASP